MAILEAEYKRRSSFPRPVKRMAKTAARASRKSVPEPESEQSQPEPTATENNTAISPFRKATYLSLAGVFFVLGVCGALLPLLPATPFFLLTSFFLAKSSPRLNAMLLRSKLIGPILVDWQLNGGVRNHVRFTAIAIVLAAVGFTIYLAGYSFWPAAIVISLASIGICVIVCLPTAKRNDKA